MVNMLSREGKQIRNYHLLNLIGEGHAARVYTGEYMYGVQDASRPTYAIKIFSQRLFNEQRLHFLLEVDKLTRLSHPHLMHLLDSGVEDGIPFLIMDYAPHGSLRDQHPLGSTLPLGTIASYVKQLASALHYIHTHQLIHNNIKPENMLVAADKSILLSDLALDSIAAASPRMRDHVTGTVDACAYIAPEFFTNNLSPASDQYSLALITYEWICGSHPFTLPNCIIPTASLNLDPAPLRVKAPRVSPAVENVVMKALSKDPGDRFASVEEFAHTLEVAALSARAIRFKSKAISRIFTPPPSHEQQKEATLPTSPLIDIEQLQTQQTQKLNKPAALIADLSRQATQRLADESPITTTIAASSAAPGALTGTIIGSLPVSTVRGTMPSMPHFPTYQPVGRPSLPSSPTRQSSSSRSFTPLLAIIALLLVLFGASASAPLMMSTTPSTTVADAQGNGGTQRNQPNQPNPTTTVAPTATPTATPIVIQPPAMTAPKQAPTPTPNTTPPPQPSQTPTKTPAPVISNAFLAAAFSTAQHNINLTQEGTLDWAHWGTIAGSTFQRKAGGSQQISDLTVVGNSKLTDYTTSPYRFTWSDGTPVASTSQNTMEVYVTGKGNGFKATVKAGTTLKRLRIYLGISQGRGQLDVTVNGPRPLTYSDNSLSDGENGVSSTNETTGMYTLLFQGDTPDSTLTLTYTLVDSFGKSRVSVLAVTLENG